MTVYSYSMITDGNNLHYISRRVSQNVCRLLVTVYYIDSYTFLCFPTAETCDLAISWIDCAYLLLSAIFFIAVILSIIFKRLYSALMNHFNMPRRTEKSEVTEKSERHSQKEQHSAMSSHQIPTQNSAMISPNFQAPHSADKKDIINNLHLYQPVPEGRKPISLVPDGCSSVSARFENDVVQLRVHLEFNKDTVLPCADNQNWRKIRSIDILEGILVAKKHLKELDLDKEYYFVDFIKEKFECNFCIPAPHVQPNKIPHVDVLNAMPAKQRDRTPMPTATNLNHSFETSSFSSGAVALPKQRIDSGFIITPITESNSMVLMPNTRDPDQLYPKLDAMPKPRGMTPLPENQTVAFKSKDYQPVPNQPYNGNQSYQPRNTGFMPENRGPQRLHPIIPNTRDPDQCVSYPKLDAVPKPRGMTPLPENQTVPFRSKDYRPVPNQRYNGNQSYQPRNTGFVPEHRGPQRLQPRLNEMPLSRMGSSRISPSSYSEFGSATSRQWCSQDDLQSVSLPKMPGTGTTSDRSTPVPCSDVATPTQEPTQNVEEEDSKSTVGLLTKIFNQVMTLGNIFQSQAVPSPVAVASSPARTSTQNTPRRQAQRINPNKIEAIYGARIEWHKATGKTLTCKQCRKPVSTKCDAFLLSHANTCNFAGLKLPLFECSQCEGETFLISRNATDHCKIKHGGDGSVIRDDSDKYREQLEEKCIELFAEE
ncbi:hypothetical protein Ddc_24571 [Ditylenchus destructor]|nr:hypothetical protein Ddc_24571 [Ditylenchus destructor]